MGAYVSKFGDWTRAGVVLQAINVNLFPMFKAQIEEDGELILEKIKGHIASQDLPWTPLSDRTIELKGGSDTIYVETGYLADNIKVRKVKSKKNGLTLFIGANAWDKHSSGVKMSDLMIWLEYGTDKIPPRPIIRPTYEEVESILHNNWSSLLEKVLRK